MSVRTAWAVIVGTALYIGTLFALSTCAHAHDVLASHYNCRAAGQCSASKRTASGERFDENALTAAHRTLPFGTRLHVCRATRCVDVRINDRGPFVRGRGLDLTTGAARRIGVTGVAFVNVWRVAP